MFVHHVTMLLLLQWVALALLFLPAMFLGRPVALLVIGLGIPTLLVPILAALYYGLLLGAGAHSVRSSAWLERKICSVESDRWVAPCLRLHPVLHLPAMFILAPVSLSNFGNLLFVRQSAGIWRIVLALAYVGIMTLAYYLFSGLPLLVVAAVAPVVLIVRLATSQHERHRFRGMVLAWCATAIIIDQGK